MRAAPEAPARVSDRPANVEGGVFVVEYHKIAKDEARWDRSIAKFKSDLQRLYDLGFRPVAMRDYLAGNMKLAPGASPVIFTFDDSHPSQFRLVDGKLDPECAVGIWQEFASKHADFPVLASFYILPSTGPWGAKSDVPEKLRLLKDWGCELGSHTISHSNLSKLSDAVVEKEFVDANRFIRDAGFEPSVIALPFGIAPKNRGLLDKHYRAALLVGAGPAPPPGSEKFDPMRIPRIQGIDEDYGLTYWLDRVESGRYQPYVEP